MVSVLTFRAVAILSGSHLDLVYTYKHVTILPGTLSSFSLQIDKGRAKNCCQSTRWFLSLLWNSKSRRNDILRLMEEHWNLRLAYLRSSVLTNCLLHGQKLQQIIQTCGRSSSILNSKYPQNKTIGFEFLTKKSLPINLALYWRFKYIKILLRTPIYFDVP